MITVNIHEAKTNLSKLLQRVMNGEEIIIAKADEPVARLVPYTKAPSKRLPGSAAGEVIISPNFDDPLPEFEL
jgi:prevent-host-death family protein